MSKIMEARNILIKEQKEKHDYIDEELAQMFNLTRERIRQIVKKK